MTKIPNVDWSPYYRDMDLSPYRRTAHIDKDGIVWQPRWRNEADKVAHIKAGLPITRVKTVKKGAKGDKGSKR